MGEAAPSDDGVEPAPGVEPGVRPVDVRDRVASLLEVVLCSGFPTQFAVTFGLAAVGVAALTPTGQLSLSFVVWLSLVDTVLMVGLVLLFLAARGERPAQVFLGTRSIAGESGLGALLVPAAFVLVAVIALGIETFVPDIRNPQGNPLAALLDNPLDAAVFALVAVLAGGVREELQRAFILHRFEQHLGGPLLGLVLFSVAFGVGHAIQGWDAAIMTGWLGVFWGLTYLWRRSIIAPAVCHAAFNLIEVLYHGLSA